MDNNTLKILFHSINAHHECQVRSIGCCCLQNGCQLHCHAADSVLTSGCSFISQQIWIKLIVMLVILGEHIKIEKSSNGKRSMYINIAGCLLIAAFPFIRSGNTTPRFFSSGTSAQGFLIRNCISSIAACANPPLAILAIFKARRMSECSGCTQPPCLAIVADMLITYKKSVAASTY